MRNGEGFLFSFHESLYINEKSTCRFGLLFVSFFERHFLFSPDKNLFLETKYPLKERKQSCDYTV